MAVGEVFAVRNWSASKVARVAAKQFYRDTSMESVVSTRLDGVVDSTGLLL